MQGWESWGVEGNKSRRQMPKGSPGKSGSIAVLRSRLRTVSSWLRGPHGVQWEQENRGMPVAGECVTLAEVPQEGASGNRVEDSGQRAGLEQGHLLGSGPQQLPKGGTSGTEPHIVMIVPTE